MEYLLVPSEKLEAIQADVEEIKGLILVQAEKSELNKWLTKQEARARLNVCMKTLDNYLSKRILPFSRFAGKTYIKASDVEAHLQRNYITK